MKLLDELLDLGDAALEDQVAVVGLALGDLAGDGGEHQLFYLGSNVDKRHTIRYIARVEQFKWDSTKNAWLKKNRGISFEDILLDIQNGKLLDKVETSNPEKYPGQKIFVVDHDGYCVLVPHIEIDAMIFLKTLFPSRVATKIYKTMLKDTKRPTRQRLSLEDKKGGKGD